MPGASGGGGPSMADPLRGWTAPLDRRTRAELALCALAVRWPEALGRHEEDLGRLAFADAGLDRLRQELLTLHASSGDLDAAAIQAELRRRGLDAALDRVLDEQPAGSARGGHAVATEQAVDAVWAVEMALLRKLALKQELASEASADLSAEAWERRRALIRAAMAEGDDGG